MSSTTKSEGWVRVLSRWASRPARSGPLQGGIQIGQGAVVDAAAVLGGGDRRADRQVSLAHTGGPRKTTFSLRSTKPGSWRLSIC